MTYFVVLVLVAVCAFVAGMFVEAKNHIVGGL